jgi:Domain of unknown function (DUF1906)
MSLASLLKRDISGRQALEKQSAELVAKWRTELARIPPAVTVDHSKPIPRSGVDFSYGRPAPSLLRRAGVTFVCRYLGGEADAISKGEVEDYSSAGLDIVTVFERAADRALEGYDAGAADATLCRKELASLGAPAHAVAYFAVDFDASTEQLGAVTEYFRGATDHLGYERVGIYGGLKAVNHVLALNACKYGWQTYAWSGTPTKWCSRAQLRQVQNGVHVAGIEVDRDEAVAADFGAWGV